ncbi:putative bifunctional diguanylate cyclase/phosphodiesterase [Actinomarinicola tropica]|uniref:EAL domain-containing protein n=1 Tax=Actinomarinicola tropica TaxID=2789776 RepID=A0A5Q2RJG7_9ACTN|nr:bifunctional diguanylate cyclase/phosphodiesterase [Actinomarinicola tropica]QGG95032.1 EAL domain-containing protein [Actinomarinicola tropica]
MTALENGFETASESLLDLIPFGVVVCTADGAIRMANRAAVDLLGQGAPIDGRSCWDLLEVAGGHLSYVDRARRAAASGRVGAIEASATVRRTVDAALPVALTLRSLAEGLILLSIRSVGDEARQAVRLRATEHRFERLATSVPAGILSSEFGMRVDFVNERATGIFGVPAEDLLGFGWLDRLHVEDSEAAECAVGEVLTTGSERVLAARVVGETGDRRVRIRISAAGSQGRDIGFVATVEDLTETHDLNEQLLVQSLQDPLTGLPNRTALWEQLGIALRDGRTQPAVLFVDLDDFKHINDSLGHTAGDHLLTVVAERLRRCARASDLVVRFGGDEFVLLLRDVPDRDIVDNVAGRVLDAISEPIDVGGTEAVVTASIGIVWPEDPGADETFDVESLVRDADIALYQAKRLGKNRAERFDEHLRDGAQRRFGIAAALRRAIDADNGEITVHYQPIIDLAAQRLVGVEALARWTHPEMGSVSPGDFVPVAEETGLITPLARLVLRRALGDVARWRRQPGGADLFVAVNMSALDLREPSLADAVGELLDELGLPGEALHLELTESAVMADPAQALGMLDALKLLGPSIAIDDFGTGYSSLAYLHRLPVDTIKIDREFVHALDDDSTALIEAIVALAGALGLPVVAEGVETEDQAAILGRLGVPLAQGFLFGRPTPGDIIDELVAVRAPAQPGNAGGTVHHRSPS